jgi:hypothetical protein
MPNIKLTYLYRDSSNYKNFGSVVIANPQNIDLNIVKELINSRLIDGCWFYAHEWQLPDLRFADVNESDPTWHEFENIEYTEVNSNFALSLEELMSVIKSTRLPIV